MAIQENGPNGPFKGKVGSVYGYKLNGQNIIRGARNKNRKPPTEAMLLNQQKMKVANNFIGSVKALMQYGYRHLAPKGSIIGPFQTAQQHILKDTMELDADCQYYVNVEKVFVFRGPLSPPTGCSVERHGKMLHMKWTVIPDYADKMYKMSFALFNTKEFIQLDIGVAEVNQGACTIPLVGYGDEGVPIHVYLGIWDSFHDLLSDSVYCGIV
ncbi:DUF6266 family protein [Sphingobacterium faecium]|uniref:DUF6266 family protein n=1 Tax=Sphingobacterium faecium TaxID=34087 RepID=UPI0021B5FC9B|nr:DUF6266 family protein [Sphingobacterium faecium]UXD69661.1 DUF6266 family protein [Sphingobacterium faecium]WGQ13210.1 DUF6266 family protein [Sphingobacterium faecium]